jgi:hypothetical protein
MKKHPFPLVPLAFYAFTCGRTIGSSDTALLVDEMRTLNLSTHVNHHNLTIVVGWLFSFVPHPNFAYVANLVSVVLGALAVSAFYWLVFEAFGRRTVAAASALLLMVSHSMWWHSTIAEVYAANALLTVIALILLQRLSRRFREAELGLLFFVAGLAIFNHAQMGVLALGAAAYLVAHLADRGKVASAPLPAGLILRCGAWFAAGILPYVLVFVKDVRREHSVTRVLDLALGGDFKAVMMKGDLIPSVLDLLFLVALQFPSPFLLAVAMGVVLLAREWKDRKALLALLVIFSVNTGFFMFYDTWDKFAFLLPSFIVLAFCGSFALHRLWLFLEARRSPYLYSAAGLALVLSLVAPIHIYSRLSHWGREPGFWQRKFGNAYANTHDVGEYMANPDKRNYREYQVFIGRLFERLPEGAIFIDDDARTYYPIKYFQKYYGQRRDLRVEMLNVWGFEGWGLGQQAFADLLEEAYQGDKPLFLISIGPPYSTHIIRIPGSERYRFREYPLSDGRWVYQLLTARAAALPPEPPRFTRVAVGQGLDTATPRERTSFSARETVMAAAYFEINGEPFPLRFRWLAPDRTIVVNDPMVLPFGCSSAWTALDRPAPLPAGAWTVEAMVGDRKVGSAAFDVRPGE